MGRSVQGHTIALRGEDAVEHRRGGAFSICAGDVESRITTLRMAEERQRPLHTMEPEINLASAEIENIIQSLCVSHS
jgi:hypothetical protein